MDLDFDDRWRFSRGDQGGLLAIILKEIAFVAIFGVHTLNGSTLGLNIDGKTIAIH